MGPFYTNMQFKKEKKKKKSNVNIPRRQEPPPLRTTETLRYRQKHTIMRGGNSNIYTSTKVHDQQSTRDIQDTKKKIDKGYIVFNTTFPGSQNI